MTANALYILSRPLVIAALSFFLGAHWAPLGAWRWLLLALVLGAVVMNRLISRVVTRALARALALLAAAKEEES